MGLVLVQLEPVRPPPEARTTVTHSSPPGRSECHLCDSFWVRLHPLCALYFMWTSLRWVPSVSHSSRQKNRTAVCEEVQAPVQGCTAVYCALAFALTLFLDSFIGLRSDVLVDGAELLLLFA